MSVDTETLILKAIEKLDQKLDKFIETTNQSLTSIQVNQARLEGDVKTLQVEVQNIKEDVKELKIELKEVRTELKEVRTDISGLYKWVIGLILTAVIGGGTIIFRVFDLFPQA